MADIDVDALMASAREDMSRLVHGSGGEQHPLPDSTTRDGGEIATRSFPLPQPAGTRPKDFPLGLVTANQIAALPTARRTRLLQFVRERILGYSAHGDHYSRAQHIREQFAQFGVEFLPTPYERYSRAGSDSARALQNSISRIDRPMAWWRASLTSWLFYLTAPAEGETHSFVYRVYETLYLVAYFFELF